MNDSPRALNFSELFEYDESEIKEKLNERVISKLIQKYDFFEQNDDKYKFKYVGLMIMDNVLIKVYPKYIPNNHFVENEFKEILRVIKKFKKENADLDYEIDTDENVSENIISMMIYLIEDYYENGVYSNYQKVLKINGIGEINWDKTINDNYPIIYENKPYYTDLYTDYKINDIYDYFHLLHECILTECSDILEKFGLLDLFDLTPLKLSERSVEDFGDADFIVGKIDKELYVQFNSQKQKILKFMKEYVSKKNIFSDKNSLILYGTTKYEHIWEKMCSKIFSNELKTKLSELNLIKPLKYKYKDYDSIYDVINYPNWILSDGDKKKSKGRLKPDIITFNNYNFVILDAKYYDLIFENEKKLDNYPGISDITKQYLYQLALDDFRKDHGYRNVQNALLFPMYDGEIENRGHVELEMFSKFDLEYIQVIMIPAHIVNEKYLNNDTINISKLKLRKRCKSRFKFKSNPNNRILKRKSFS